MWQQIERKLHSKNTVLDEWCGGFKIVCQGINCNAYPDLNVLENISSYNIVL